MVGQEGWEQKENGCSLKKVTERMRPPPQYNRGPSNFLCCAHSNFDYLVGTEWNLAGICIARHKGEWDAGEQVRSGDWRTDKGSGE